MKRLRTLAILLVVTFSLAACGGDGAQQSEPADSPDSQRTEPTTGSAGTEPNADDAVTENTDTEETAAEEDAAQEPVQGNRGEEASSGAAGTNVTTLDGEQVSVGGGGDATALFFMAGW